MSSSFPKPARRKSASAGSQNTDHRSGRSGHSSRQRKAVAARPERAPEEGGRAGVWEGGKSTSGSAVRNQDVLKEEEQLSARSESRSSGSGGKRGSGQEAAPVLPGIKPVLELLQSAPERVDAIFLRKGRHGKEMERIVDLCRTAGVRFSLLEPASFARVYEGHSQGVVARLFEAGFADFDDLLTNVTDAPLPLVLVLDQVQDPGNAGTLARTLYALGGAGLVAPRHNGVYLGAAAAKASAGALDKLPVSKVPNLAQALDSAKKCGFTIYGASSGYGANEAGVPDREQPLNGRQPAVLGLEKPPVRTDAAKNSPARVSLAAGKPVLDVFDVTPRLPAMLILGSEEDGMRAGMEKRCDYLIRIPMLRDFDSLNVAQAGGIIISWFAHWASRNGKTAKS